MKSAVKFLAWGLGVGGLIIVGGGGWWQWAIKPVNSRQPETAVVVIQRGQSVEEVGRKLKTAGLVRSVTAFKFWVIKRGLTKKIQAGDFRLTSAMSLNELIDELTHGTLDIWVTFPEGWRREQIAARLAEELSQRGEAFDQAKFLILSQNKEGYLFPDTYLIPKQASEAAIIQLLGDTFEKKARPELAKNQTGLTEREVVNLAAIIEREARGEADRQLVVNILVKRLKMGIGLNADATLQYILGTPDNWWPVPTAADKLINSAYNTYKYKGLPPGPIANPGLKAMQAVLRANDTPYLYYLHDKQGGIHQAKTLAEQTENIRRYLTP